MQKAIFFYHWQAAIWISFPFFYPFYREAFSHFYYMPQISICQLYKSIYFAGEQKEKVLLIIRKSRFKLSFIKSIFYTSLTIKQHKESIHKPYWSTAKWSGQSLKRFSQSINREGGLFYRLIIVLWAIMDVYPIIEHINNCYN